MRLQISFFEDMKLSLVWAESEAAEGESILHTPFCCCSSSFTTTTSFWKSEPIRGTWVWWIPIIVGTTLAPHAQILLSPKGWMGTLVVWCVVCRSVFHFSCMKIMETANFVAIRSVFMGGCLRLQKSGRTMTTSESSPSCQCRPPSCETWLLTWPPASLSNFAWRCCAGRLGFLSKQSIDLCGNHIHLHKFESKKIYISHTSFPFVRLFQAMLCC